MQIGRPGDEAAAISMTRWLPACWLALPVLCGCG